jgi:sulfide dehydrogenase cytochrome subunit
MKRSRACAVGALGLAMGLWAGPAMSQQPAPAFAPSNLSEAGVRALAAGCAMCHGPEGNPATGSIVPALAGRPAREIVDAMNAFREGRREATVMNQIAKGYSEAEIAALGEYFAGRTR